jgi:hypothetical protein
VPATRVARTLAKENDAEEVSKPHEMHISILTMYILMILEYDMK